MGNLAPRLPHSLKSTVKNTPWASYEILMSQESGGQREIKSHSRLDAGGPECQQWEFLGFAMGQRQACGLITSYLSFMTFLQRGYATGLRNAFKIKSKLCLESKAPLPPIQRAKLSEFPSKEKLKVLLQAPEPPMPLGWEGS